MKLKIERFYPFIVFLFAFLLYANTIPNDYNLDDELVTINHRTTSKGISGIREIFTSYYYEDDMGYKYEYRPITHLSFALEHEIFGEDPHISHTFNVLLYTCLALLVFYFVMAIAPQYGKLLAFIAALLFVLHPIHTEVVASIKNRDEILSLMFALLAFFVGLKSNGASNFFKAAMWGILAAACYGLSIYAKMSGIIFLVLLPTFLFLTKSFKLSDLIFVFLSSYLLNLSFNVTPIEELLYAIAITTFFGLLHFLLNVFNFRSFIYTAKDFLASSKGMYSVLFTSYLFAIVGVYFNLPLLYVLAGGIASLYLAITVKKEKDNFKFFALVYPVVLLLSYRFNFAFLSFPFFYIMAYFSRENSKSFYVNQILFFAVISVPVVLVNDKVILSALLPLFFLFFQRIKNILLVIWAFFVLHVVVHIPFLFIIFFLSAVYLLALVYFSSEKKLNPSFLFLGIALSSFGYLIEFETYFNLDRSLIKDETTLTELFDAIVDEQTENDFKEEKKEESAIPGLERDILYVENPIIENWDWEHRLALTFNTNLFYVNKLIVPYPMLFYYGFDQFELNDFKHWKTILAMVLFVMLIVYGVWSLLNGRYLVFFLILWLELGILSFSNLFTPIAGIVGERLVFSASLAYCILIAFFIIDLLKVRRFKVVLVSFCTLIALLSIFLVVNRNFQWKNKMSLFSHDIKMLENSAQANALYADACMVKASQSKEVEETKSYVDLGEKHFQRATTLYPNFINWWIDLGKVQKIKGAWQAADASFQKARDLDPNYTKLYEDLVEISIARNDTDAIIEYLNILLFFNPEDVSLMFDLSSWFYVSEAYEDVVKINSRIIDVDNSLPEAYLNKSYAYIKLGNKLEAKKQLEYARLLNPDHGDIPLIERQLE